MKDINLERIVFRDSSFMSREELTQTLGRRIKIILDSVLSTADAIELAHITKILREYRDIQEELNQSIEILIREFKRFFKQTPFEKMIADLEEEPLRFEYLETLWSELVSEKRYLENIEPLLHYFSGSLLQFPLSERKIVLSCDETLTDLLVCSVQNAEFLLDETLSGRIIIPASFSGQIKDGLLFSYVRDSNSNLNYFDVIINDKTLSPDLRLLAQESKELRLSKLFEEHEGQYFKETLGISFTRESNFEGISSIEVPNSANNYSYMIKFNEQMLTEYLDPLAIIQNFITVFEFVDQFGILVDAKKTEEDSSLLRVLRPVRTGEFDVNSSFVHKDSIHQLMFRGYYDFLKRNKINLEEIISWFWSAYLSEKFGIKNSSLRLRSPSRDYPVFDAQNNLTAQFHRAVKIWDLISTGQTLNDRIIDYVPSVPPFDQLKSTVSDKYIVLSDKKIIDGIKSIEVSLFSDQSSLPKEDGIPFGDLITSKEYSPSTLNSRQEDILSEMVKKQILKNDGKNYRYSSVELYTLLKCDFDYDCVPAARLSVSLKKVQNIIGTDESKPLPKLLTPNEADLFEYNLTNKFSNGLAIRNIYAHGSANGLTTDEHESNYFRTLYCLVLFTLKVNDDLHFRDIAKARL